MLADADTAPQYESHAKHSMPAEDVICAAQIKPVQLKLLRPRPLDHLPNARNVFSFHDRQADG